MFMQNINTVREIHVECLTQISLANLMVYCHWMRLARTFQRSTSNLLWRFSWTASLQVCQMSTTPAAAASRSHLFPDLFFYLPFLLLMFTFTFVLLPLPSSTPSHYQSLLPRPSLLFFPRTCSPITHSPSPPFDKCKFVVFGQEKDPESSLPTKTLVLLRQQR